jgi:dUTP pyrophosphatase
MAVPTLRIERTERAKDLDLPRYMSEGASGLDVAACVDVPVTIAPGDIALVPTGLKLSIPQGFEVQVRARSGLARRHGITVVNGPGTIDSDYRGEVGVILGNVGREPFTVTRGMRIAQLVCAPVVRAQILEVDSLDATERGAGGFGSTGLSGAAGRTGAAAEKPCAPA